MLQRGTQVSPGTAPGRPYFRDHMVPSCDRDSLSPLDRIKKVREITGCLGRGHRSHTTMVSDNQIVWSSRHPQGVTESEFSGFDSAPCGRISEQVAKFSGGVDHRTPAMPDPDGDVVAVDVAVDRTAVTGSAWVLPVRVLVARPSRRGCRLAMGTAIPLASSTLVPGVKLIPPQVAAASASRPAGTQTDGSDLLQAHGVWQPRFGQELPMGAARRAWFDR